MKQLKTYKTLMRVFWIINLASIIITISSAFLSVHSTSNRLDKQLKELESSGSDKTISVEVYYADTYEDKDNPGYNFLLGSIAYSSLETLDEIGIEMPPGYLGNYKELHIIFHGEDLNSESVDFTDPSSAQLLFIDFEDAELVNYESFLRTGKSTGNPDAYLVDIDAYKGTYSGKGTMFGALFIVMAIVFIGGTVVLITFICSVVCTILYFTNRNSPQVLAEKAAIEAAEQGIHDYHDYHKL